MECNNIHTIAMSVASSGATTPSYAYTKRPLVLQWYPLRIFYPGPKKILRVKDFFDGQGIQNFVPMEWTITDDEKGRPCRKLVPAILNLIVIRAYEDQLTELKEEFPSDLCNVNYRHDHQRDGLRSAPIIVSDREMERFMSVVNDHEDSLTYINPAALEDKKGRDVRIVGGQFKGAEGVLMRIDNNRHVVVHLHGVCSVKLNHIPISNIRFIDN